MSTVAITGSTGFIGQSLIPKLLATGHSVKALVRSSHHTLPATVQPIIGTLHDPQSLRVLVEGADTVIHLAGATAALSEAEFFATNASGTTQLVDVLEAQRPIARLIHVSSLAAREPHLSSYAASKKAAEDVVTSSKLSWTIVRPPAVYGPKDRELKPLWQALSKGILPRIGPSDAHFSLLHVEDLADALETLLQPSNLDYGLHALFEIDDGYEDLAGYGYRWTTLTDIGSRHFNRSIWVLPCPTLLLSVLGHLSDWLAQWQGVPRVFGRGKVSEMTHINWVSERSKAINYSVWSPKRPLHDTLSTLI